MEAACATMSNDGRTFRLLLMRLKATVLEVATRLDGAGLRS
jgi:hypothetical protein